MTIKASKNVLNICPNTKKSPEDQKKEKAGTKCATVQLNRKCVTTLQNICIFNIFLNPSNS